ncbi:cytochrome b/b6 domain-containing protein [Archaeoglobus neptunius]|uniref:cytochrome b/b6 domain-containing protein n=1 Tax=Archaeoglobus neptunius TaxID=2798580 RepID=UPI00192819C4|nr:cytochrome b/b6 domain-containing protein [Archaeoglobus neptunius]
MCKKCSTVKVERHSKFVRSCHWGIVVTGIVTGLTGLQLANLFGINFFDDAYALHIRMSFIFAGLWALFIYFSLLEEWKWLKPSRIPYSIKFVMEEAVAWVKGGHVDDPRAYDPRRKEYVEKIIPSQVLVWWTYLLLTAIIGLTGLAMLAPDTFKPVFGFASAIAPLFGTENAYAFVRAVHKFTMFLYATVMITHAYAATIFGTLSSMINGIRREKVVSESTGAGSGQPADG